MNATKVLAFANHLEQVNHSLTQAQDEILSALTSSEYSQQKENLLIASDFINKAKTLSNEIVDSLKVLRIEHVKGDVENDLKTKSYQINHDANEAYKLIASIKKSIRVAEKQKQKSAAQQLESKKLVNNGSCCSYDAYDDTPISQENYSCTSCWGKDSSFRICLYCKLKCHNDHTTTKYKQDEESEEKNRKIICACGKLDHNPKLCTRKLTKFDHVVQPYFICYDCFDTKDYPRSHNQNNLVVCFICMKQCHRDHHIEVYKAGLAVCDCGLPGCKTVCESQ